MPTGQTVISNVLTKLQLLEPNGIAGTSDSATCLAELNNMWQAWGIDEGLIYAVLASRFPLTASIGTYTIGPTGTVAPNFNSPRPARIYKAVISQASGNAINSNSLYAGGTGYVVNDTGVILGSNGTFATYTVNSATAGAVVTYTISGAGTGYTPMLGASTATGGGQAGVGTGFRISIASVTAGGMNRNELKIVEAGEYYAHNDLSASGAIPDELYPDYNANADGFASLYLFPVPLVLAATVLEIEAAVNFSTWTLAANYLIPQGYQDCIEWTLAFRCATFFGEVVSQQTMQLCATEATKAEARLRKMNVFNRKMPDQGAMAPGSTPPQQAA